jgi:UrcA family protein
MTMRVEHVSPAMLGLICVAGLLAASAPAFGQGAGEFTVLGHNEMPYDHSLTATVSYRDLDLATHGGRAALRARVWRTAEKLCARLGETHIGGVSMARSCEDQALYSAAEQQRDAIARATSPTYAGTVAAGAYVLTMSVEAMR